MLLDSGFADHWPDAIFAAFIACVVWLFKRDISAFDKRHQRAEDKLEAQDKIIASHNTRISVLEAFRQRIHRSDD